jgi:SAM-dependent methyltransferase
MNRFETFYEWGLWGNDGDGSGTGSTLAFTKNLIGLLTSICKTHNFKQILDLPCGAGLWQTNWIKNLPDIEYVGVDVSQTAVNRFKQRLVKNDLKAKIVVGDLSKPILGDYSEPDLVLCRDALQHLPLLSIVDILQNIASLKPKMLLVGSYLNGSNRQISIGKYFSIDLAKAPFNMVPDWILPELHDDSQIKKYLYIYSSKTLESINWVAIRDEIHLKT